MMVERSPMNFSDVLNKYRQKRAKEGHGIMSLNYRLKSQNVALQTILRKSQMIVMSTRPTTQYATKRNLRHSVQLNIQLETEQNSTP